MDMLEPYVINEGNIPFHIMLLSTLNFYGYGSFQRSIGGNYIFGLSQSSASRCINKISKVIVLKLSHFVFFPTTTQEINEVKEKFLETFGVNDVIGCVDCTHVAITPPIAKDPIRPSRLYVNRKGFHSINVEMICDSEMRLLSVNTRFPGSVHDSAIWSTSRTRLFLMSKYTTENRFILFGDSGYPLEPWLFIPFNQNTLNSTEKKFNKKQIKARMTIERTFGVLKSRFPALSKTRALYYKTEIAGNIINAICIIYNFLINKNDRNFEEDESTENENKDFEIRNNVNIFTEGTAARNVYAQQF